MNSHASRPSIWLSTVLAFVCVPHLIAQSANLIFEDNFSSNTLDTSKWTVGFHDPDTGDIVPGAQDQFLLNNNYAGYITEEAVLIGFETRTSSPVRIPRDPETLQHPSVARLFPCGEGAGFAGGIVSAALDGMRCAEALVAEASQVEA